MSITMNLFLIEALIENKRIMHKIKVLENSTQIQNRLSTLSLADLFKKTSANKCKH